MIKELYPTVYRRYLSLPVLGSILDSFDNWLLDRGYCRHTRLLYVNDARRIDDHLHHKQGLQCLEELTLDDLHSCWRRYYSRKVRITRTVLNVRKFLQWQEVLPADPEKPNRFRSYLDPYRDYLTEVRGLSEKTISDHLATVSHFLAHLAPGQTLLKLEELTASNVEAFISHIGGRLKRESLQHVIAHLRSFLRWLALAGNIPPGLDAQIDTPRVYRLEQLPRALPWETVCAFLDSIDRETPIGLRD
ncbi:MAG: site-specific integrase [gamma proteobacterium endosymbiont of Lamellibrachia anaximandri]|nr:site-specific integrase [gamma proteobacterium endosymbiont of Lamellibrachia anaximandri]MBL3535646.1 site-specific integrase [gamma proteobacterium endosymbiont of Lamellibrachia anaximandri]